MRIRSTLIWTGAGLLLVAALVFALLLWVAREGEHTTQAQQASEEVARSIASLLTLTQEYALFGGARPAQQWRARHAQLMRALDDEAGRGQGAAAAALPPLRAQAAELGKLFARLEPVDRCGADALAGQRQLLLQERLLVETQEMVELRHAWVQQISARDARQQQLLVQAVVAGLGAILALAAITGWWLQRQLLRPLRRLEAATHAIAPGMPVGARPALSGDNELSHAGRAVYAMADRLLDEQSRLKLIIDHVPALISQLDAAGHRFTLVNQAYLDWNGRALAEVVGRSVGEVHGPALHAQLEPLLERARRGAIAAAEVELSDGRSAHTMQASYVPRLDESGQVVAIYGLMADVSEARRAEARLRLTMEASPLGIFIREREGELLYANPAWLRLAGVDARHARALRRVNLVHADDLQQVKTAFEAAADGREVPPMEVRYTQPDGTIVWVRAHLRQFEGPGPTEGVLGLFEDITERKALDELLAQRTRELQRSNRDLEHFAYAASHDLQEPLRMVSSYGQLLLRRHAAALPDEAREFVGFMVDGGQRAQALVRDLLSLARLDSQAKPFSAVSLQAVLRSSLQLLREPIARSAAEISHAPLPSVLGDAGQLGQLLTNLIGNALKFCGPHAPKIHIDVQRAGPSWQFAVRDQGIGIEPRFFERIFVMFQRLHLRSEHPGTGIGLAICKRVVERHGGRIWVESAPGAGATFYFTLPRPGSALQSGAGREHSVAAHEG